MDTKDEHTGTEIVFKKLNKSLKPKTFKSKSILFPLLRSKNNYKITLKLDSWFSSSNQE